MKNNNKPEFIKFLEHRLKKPLPGYQSQIKMAMKIENKLFRKFKRSITARNSAVMIVISGNNNLQLLLTLRSTSLRQHGNQISFPGGRCEPDETFIEAAIRETQEETGLIINKEQIIGELSELYVPPSDSLIKPIIAYIDQINHTTPNPDEVEEIFLVDLAKFTQSETLKWKKIKIEGYDVDTPYWDVHPSIPLWGATSMILSELKDIFLEWK